MVRLFLTGDKSNKAVITLNKQGQLCAFCENPEGRCLPPPESHTTLARFNTELKTS